MNETVSICSFNCRGLGDKRKRADVLNFLNTKKFSIVCLQDVHWTCEMENQIKLDWGYDCFFSHGTSNSRGTAILLNDNFIFKAHGYKSDPGGNWVILDITFSDIRVSLANIYGPNQDDPSFYKNIMDEIESYNNAHSIICGDFNLVQQPNMDTMNYNSVGNPKARKEVLNMMNIHDLIDPWRENNPTARRYTWRQPTPFKQGRLDFFLLSHEMFSMVDNTDILPGYRSDHSIPTVTFAKQTPHRGRGYWKFNNSLLKDTKYIQVVKDAIGEIVKQYAASPYSRENMKNIPGKEVQFNINDQLLLDMILVDIRGKTIPYGASMKRKREKEIKSLEAEISRIDHTLDLNPTHTTADTLMEDLKSANKKLQELRDVHMEGVKIRARVQNLEFGEKPSKYFLNLEKKNYVNKSINFLEKQNGIKTNSQKEILEEAKMFYENLYSDKEKQIDTSLLDTIPNIPTLSEDESSQIDGVLEYDEVLNALKSMQNNKTPGPDGFTVEFFKFFWKDLSSFIIRALNSAFDRGSFSHFQNLGVITLLPKGNKPRQHLKNWRPISLLNSIYKLASMCIANRVKGVLPKLIEDDQNGFMAGRFIGENIRIVYDIIFHAEEKSIPGMLLLIDFEKAFDTVSHSFIFKILKRHGFGTSIQKWIRLFYNNAESSLLINGNMSDRFFVNRGCRQGDPLSPYLFLLCAEVLATMARNNHDMKGIVIDNKEFKISQFADDTTFILDGSERSLVETLNVLDQFAVMSGLRINSNKTNVVWIGSKRKELPLSTCSHLNWVRNRFSMLGVDFSLDLHEMPALNYSSIVEDIRKSMKQWSKRYLTVLGRIAVVKSLFISRFSHLVLAIPNPDCNLIHELNNMFFNFIWKGKTDRIGRDQMCGDFDEGGTKMIQVGIFFNALKISWIRRLLRAGSSNKAVIMFLYFSQLKDMDNFICGTCRWTNSINKMGNIFWKEVLLAWNSFQHHMKLNDCSEVLRSCIWNNPQINIGGNTVFYSSWVQNGILYINDLMDPEGGFYSLEALRRKYVNLRTNFLEYHGLIRTITESFRKVSLFTNAKPVAKPFIPINIDILLKDKKGCRRIYKILLPNFKNKAKLKWSQQLQYIDDNKWKTICSAPFECTGDIKLRWFQFRITQRILSTNYFLKMIKVSSEDRCSFCYQVQETIYHIFCMCPITNTIWRKLEEWILCKCKIKVSLCDNDILFGKFPIRKHTGLNNILLIAKFAVYRNRCNGSKPSFQNIQHDIIKYHNTEKHMWKKSLKNTLYLKKWDVFHMLFV